MIMHGTWYKGPQLAHHPHSNPHNSSHGHSDYHQFRSYPSFVVTPYHDGHVQGPATPTPCTAPPTPCNGPVPVSVPVSIPVCHTGGQGSPVIVESSFAIAAAAAAAAAAVAVGGSSATPLLPSPPIKIEQVFGEPSSLGAVVEDYALGLDCPVEHTFRVSALKSLQYYANIIYEYDLVLFYLINTIKYFNLNATETFI